jgi:hypothetical protein
MWKAFWVILVSLVLAALVLGLRRQHSNKQAAYPLPKQRPRPPAVADTATPAQKTTPPDTEKPVYAARFGLTALLPASPMGGRPRPYPRYRLEPGPVSKPLEGRR